jgi:hypothetical protein
LYDFLTHAGRAKRAGFSEFAFQSSSSAPPFQ